MVFAMFAGCMALAGNEGVQAFDAVDQPHLLQKRERPIDGWGFGRTVGMEAVDNVIGLNRRVLTKDQFKRAQARRGHTFALRLAQALRFGQTRLNTAGIKLGVGVIVFVVAGM